MIQMKFKHFVILQILDVLTTYIALTYLNLSEANSFANTLFNQFGLINALIAMKILGIMVIYLLLRSFPLKIKIIGINIIVFMYIIVILNNLFWMVI